MEFSKNPLVNLLNKLYEYAKNNLMQVLIAFVGVIFFIILLLGYFWYRSNLQVKAHKEFLQAVKILDSKVDASGKKDFLKEDVFTSKEEKWTKVVQIFDDVYQKNKSAGIATVFLSHKVEALINLGKLLEAIEVQKELVKNIPKKSSLLPYAKIKLALMNIDTGSENLISQGISNIKDIANETDNIAQDEALYRLGEYYWFNQNFDEAKNYWNQLIIKFGKTSREPSWRVNLAKSKLKTITSK